jgi:hypothetical protein
VRSSKELQFRIGQELANLALFASPPTLPGSVDQPPPLGLPELIERYTTTDVVPLAEKILRHQFPILGIEIETGNEIEWRRDYLHNISTGTKYFRLIPYLDFDRAGDHKIIWELNRHQHLVVLAQAFRRTGRTEFLTGIVSQLESWFASNPFMRGINWTSALEVAFRVLSWIWVYDLTGAAMPDAFRRRLLNGIYQHGCYLEHNLSIYFSPNTHLLGEAVALHALGVLFPAFPRSAKWKQRGAAIVREAMDRQVRDDGTHFEQSTYYHVYALDFFLLHELLGGELSREKLIQMAKYLEAVMGPRRILPFLGDDDGGRLFHPYGDRDKFGRETLALASAASDPAASQLFPNAGIAVLVHRDLQIVADFGRFGEGSGGHSHSDTLCVVAFLGHEEILIDPGTYTYIAEPKLRDWFRSSAAHNTIRVDGLDQATAAGPFRWHDPPECEALGLMEGVCRYRGITHRRKLALDNQRLVITDSVEGSAGEHLIDQFWHPGEATVQLSARSFQIGSRARIDIDPAFEVTVEDGWRSRVLGQKTPAPYLQASRRCTLPATFTTAVDFSG